MAGVSKVSYGDEVIIDLTSDTVTRQSLLSGVTAHAANGDLITGALELGALAYLNDLSYASDLLKDKPVLGLLAALNSISYNSDLITDKPVFPKLGALATRDYIEYSSSFLTNKPDFHKLAFQDFIDYESEQLKNKPKFGDLAFLNSLSYESDRITDKPTPLSDVIRQIADIYPDLPAGIQMFASMASGGLKFPSDVLSYQNGGVVVNTPYINWFTVVEYENTTGVIYHILDQLSDFVKLDYGSDQIRNKPVFGELAFQNGIDYNSDQLYNKPTSLSDVITKLSEIYTDLPAGIQLIGSLSGGGFKFPESILSYRNGGVVVNDPYTDWFICYADDYGGYSVNVTIKESISDYISIDWNSDQIYNKPTPVEDIMATIMEVVPDIPYGVVMAVYSSDGILKFDDSIVSYEDNGIVFNESNVRGVHAAYTSDTNSVAFTFSAQNYIPDAPNDGKRYVRCNGNWVEL